MPIRLQVAGTYPLYPLLGKPQTTLFRFSSEASHFGVKLVSTIALGSEQLFSSDKLVEMRQWQGHWFVVHDEVAYGAETTEGGRGLPRPSLIHIAQGLERSWTFVGSAWTTPPVKCADRR